MLKLLPLAALALIVSPDVAFAAGDVMDSATSKITKVFESVKKIVFVLGGFGLVGLAVGAIFGAVKWKWFASLAVGLAILAAAGAIVNYVAGDGATGISDSFKE